MARVFVWELPLMAYWYDTSLYCPNKWTCLHILWEISQGSEYTREELEREARQSAQLIIFLFFLFYYF